METNGSIDADEASAALAAVRRSRARVAWHGYPAWYWFGIGAVLSAASLAILVPTLWGLAIAATATAALVLVTRAASRARGVCEGWTGAMTHQDVAVLYGPAAVVIVTSSVIYHLASWWPIAAAVLVFGLFAGTGLTLSARAARR